MANDTVIGSIWNTDFLDLNGKVKQLSRPDQRPLLINFWATWCEPCREEMADLSALAITLKEKVDFVGIAIDNTTAIEAFLDKQKIAYPLLLGQADVLALMQSEGNAVGGLPFTVVYNTEGQKIATISGKIQKDQLKTLLLKTITMR